MEKASLWWRRTELLFEMIVLVDNYDSFTYNLTQYLRLLGKDVLVKRNDELTVSEVQSIKPSLIVFSPGPGGPESTGRCIEILDVFHREIPILGVCLGMQTIASYFGGRIKSAAVPVHGKVRSIRHNAQGLFYGLPNPLQVTRYHSLVVDPDSLPPCLAVSATSEEGEVMGIYHNVYPISGVQFHPEAYLTECGLELLENALEAHHV